MIDFSGRTVWITAAAGGIGQALCATFSKAGARVIAFDSNAKGLDAVRAEQKVALDLTDPKALTEVLGPLLQTSLPYALVSNLGWTRDEHLGMVTDESLLHEIDINLTATIRLTRLVAPAMAAKGEGNFVYTSSVNAAAHFGNPTYSAAKAGLEAFARAVATEYGPLGLRANCVAPASVRTYAWDHRFAADPEIARKISALYPLGRMIEPGEVAAAAAFLASPLASGISGTVLRVDGGLMAANLGFLDAIAPNRE